MVVAPFNAGVHVLPPAYRVDGGQARGVPAPRFEQETNMINTRRARSCRHAGRGRALRHSAGRRGTQLGPGLGAARACPRASCPADRRTRSQKTQSGSRPDELTPALTCSHPPTRTTLNVASNAIPVIFSCSRWLSHSPRRRSRIRQDASWSRKSGTVARQPPSPSAAPATRWNYPRISERAGPVSPEPDC